MNSKLLKRYTGFWDSNGGLKNAHQRFRLVLTSHSDSAGNEEADELARRGSVMDTSQVDNTLFTPLCYLFRNRNSSTQT